MSQASDLDMLAEEFGILPSFHDLSGTLRPTSAETKHALLRANGFVLDNDAMIVEALAETRAARQSRSFPPEIVVESGAEFGLDVYGEAEWRLEPEGRPADVIEGRAEGRLTLPPLPSGVHTLTVTRGDNTEALALIAAPNSCPSVEAVTGRPRIWGANLALYGLQSSRNCGLGNFGDLASAAEVFASHGADFLGINPLHSIGWSDRGTISPYSPSHREFLNTSHIATHRQGDMPESGETAGEVRYPDFIPGHQQRLEALYEGFRRGADGRSDFSAYCRARGDSLLRFAAYEALSEVHGPDWHGWPERLRNDGTNALDTATADLAQRVEFHQWLQWTAESQLADAQTRAKQAGMGLGLYLDLAVGPRRGGAESWCERDSVAEGVSLGAPPDHLSPDGQNWQLMAYAPRKLAQRKYRPWRRIIAQTMRHAGVLRIDHVLGMNRSYWIPDDGSPGGYIRQPFDTLLALIAIEAERAGTVVIGEDLGLVPEGFREALGARGFYSYSVLQYERDGEGRLRQPDTLRPNSLLCFGTHDTPTLRGFWAGRDIDWWRKLDWIDNGQAAQARERREGDRQALLDLGPGPAPETRTFEDAKQRVHAAMGASPVAMVSVQLDDLCDQTEAQNLPGTIDEHPNWRRRCPVPVERFDSDLSLRELGATMKQCGRGQPPDQTEGEGT